MEFFDLENPLLEDDEPVPIGRLFEVETEYMAAEGYFQHDETHRRRQLAASNMQQIVVLAEIPNIVYDPRVPFLALAYYDRAMSRQLVPVPEKRFFALFTLSCITLAWKRTADVFPTGDLLDAFSLGIQVEEVTEMELRILTDLDWRMRSVTPLCFLNFFMDLMDIDDPPQRQALKIRSIEEYVCYMHYETEFTRFRPSIIAASGLLAERAEHGPIGHFLSAILRCEYVNTDELEDCLNLLQLGKDLNFNTAVPESDEDDDDDEDNDDDDDDDDDEDDVNDDEDEDEDEDEETLQSLANRMRKGGRQGGGRGRRGGGRVGGRGRGRGGGRVGGRGGRRGI